MVHRRTKEVHRLFAKENNGKYCFKNQLEITNNLPSRKKSTHAEMLFNEMRSEDSFKVPEGQRLRQFRRMTRKFVVETPSKTTRSFEAGQRRKKFSAGLSVNTNRQHKIYRTPSVRTLRSSALMKTKHEETPTSSSSAKNRKALKTVQRSMKPFVIILPDLCLRSKTEVELTMKASHVQQ